MACGWYEGEKGAEIFGLVTFLQGIGERFPEIGQDFYEVLKEEAQDETEKP